MFGQSNGLENTLPSNQVVPDAPAKKPKGYYDRGEDFPMEDQVAFLVEMFAETKRRDATNFDLFGWRKTFRIMLDHHRIPFDDIVLVVTALADRRLHLDFDRYNAPYDLHRDGEWSVWEQPYLRPAGATQEHNSLAIEFAILILSQTYTPANT